MNRNRKGFSLMEVMVALSILAITLMSLARFSMIIMQRGRGNDLVAKRTAVLQLEANKFEAVPYSTLAGWSTVDKTFTRGDFTYTRKLTITAPASTRYTIKVVVVPSADATRKDSITLERTLPPSGSALCVGC